MNQLLELPNEIKSLDPFLTGTEHTVLKEDYQRLLLAYQSVRQERDMLRKAMRAFRLSRVRRKVLGSADYVS